MVVPIDQRSADGKRTVILVGAGCLGGRVHGRGCVWGEKRGCVCMEGGGGGAVPCKRIFARVDVDLIRSHHQRARVTPSLGGLVVLISAPLGCTRIEDSEAWRIGSRCRMATASRSKSSNAWV
jgi:hypothetical protein